MNIVKNKIFILLTLTLFSFGFLSAGDIDRVGTASGTQTLVPAGARGLSMGGSDIAYTRGTESIYWNPAGLADLEKGEALFSNRNILANINLNYVSMGYSIGNNSLGLSIKSFNFGEIEKTTVQHPDGTGATFSPTFATIGAVYSRQMTSRINFGMRPKVIYENIEQASSTSFAFDFGLQYRNLFNVNGLGLGLFIKNIGTDKLFDGSGLLTYSRDKNDEKPTSHNEYRKIQTESHNLPTLIKLGTTYKFEMGNNEVTLATAYKRKNFAKDVLNLGTEICFYDMLYFRTGYNFDIGEVDIEEGNVDTDNYGASDYQFTIGGGLQYTILDIPLKIGYNYMPGNYFSASQSFTVVITF